MQQGLGDDDDDDDDDGDDGDDDLIYYTLYHNQEKGEWERVRSELIRRREAAEKAQEELEVKLTFSYFSLVCQLTPISPIDTNLTN